MSITLIRGGPFPQQVLDMEPGALCIVTGLHDAQPGRFAWSALLNAAAVSISSAWLVAPRRAAARLHVPPELAPASEAAQASGRIKVLRHQLSAAAPQQVGRLLEEFDYFSIGAGALLVIDCADDWLALTAPALHSVSLELLQRWAQRRQVAVLLVSHARSARMLPNANRLLGLARHFSGVAQLTAVGPGRLALEQLYWFAPTAVVAKQALQLAIDAGGLLQIDQPAHALPERALAPDAGIVIVQRSALAGSSGVPAHWRVCDSLDAVVVACADAPAATVILTFERTTPQDYLMQTVYRLRRQAGARLKIIVRELHVRLRYNEEALIARLGANLIVPMEVGYARYLSMMEMLQSQLFAGSLPATYEQARSEGLPQEEAGYLPPQVFAQTVAAALERSRALAIDNVLVRLTLGTGLTALDAMRHCTVKRAGDVFSGDRKSVMVFLFACREMDATQTLERLFALPVSELFASEHRYISNPAAASAIEEFGQRAAVGSLPDLSQPLREIIERRMPGLERGPITAAQAAGIGSVTSAQRYPHAVATPPLHTPLQLRHAGEPGIVTQGQVP